MFELGEKLKARISEKRIKNTKKFEKRIEKNRKLNNDRDIQIAFLFPNEKRILRRIFLNHEDKILFFVDANDEMHRGDFTFKEFCHLSLNECRCFS
jgi:hypothetical protein